LVDASGAPVMGGAAMAEPWPCYRVPIGHAFVPDQGVRLDLPLPSNSSSWRRLPARLLCRINVKPVHGD